MATWKTNFPERNLGPNRYINDDIVSGGAAVGTTLLVASYRKLAVQNVGSFNPDLQHTILTWDGTDMPAPWSVLTQPFASLSGGTDVTVTLDGVYKIAVNVTVSSQVLELKPDLNIEIWKDDGVTPVEIGTGSPARVFAESGGYQIGGTATSHARLSAGDSIYIQAESASLRTTLANYGTTLTIFKIAD